MFLLKAYWIASCTIEKLGVMVSYMVAINNSVTLTNGAGNAGGFVYLWYVRLERKSARVIVHRIHGRSKHPKRVNNLCLSVLRQMHGYSSAPMICLRH